ncbi:MAG: hypothetical protein IKH30_09695 [Clostridia bacterium]|nr:hypothetical protein [Clostridia bacterium]
MLRFFQKRNKPKKENILDKNGNIIDKRIERDVSRKVNWYYVHDKLYSARMYVKRLEVYKRKIAEVNAALEQEDVERAIDAMYFDEDREIPSDRLEKKLKHYWSNDDDRPAPWRTIEEEKAEARKLYQEKGFAGFQKLAKLHNEIFFKSKSIDELIKSEKDELRRIEIIVKLNPPGRAQRLLHRFGDCHFLWGIEKRILKTDYGVDWQTPAERFPNIYFD